MSHEVSETIQDVDGKWINVYGRGTKLAGKRLPPDASGVGHEIYDSVEEAVAAAKARSAANVDAHDALKRGFDRARGK